MMDLEKDLKDQLESEEAEVNVKSNRMVVIDEENISCDDDNRSEDLPANNGALLLQVSNACPNCEAFRENADRAWDVIQKLAKENEQQRILQNENHQLNNICKENRNYIATLRSIEEALKETLKQKEKDIMDRDEKIDNLQKQYNEVLKAGSEIKKYLEERNFWQKNCENLDEERMKLQQKFNKSVEVIKDLNSKLKIASDMILEQTVHSTLDTTEDINFEYKAPSNIVEAVETPLNIENAVVETPINIVEAVVEAPLNIEDVIETPLNIVEAAVETPLNIDKVVLGTPLKIEAFFKAPLNIVDAVVEDLELTLPPSPPMLATQTEINASEFLNEELAGKISTTEEDQKLFRLPPIESIFNSSFFVEMQKMPLIKDDIIVPLLEKPVEINNLMPTMKPELKINLPPGKEPSSYAIHRISKQYNVDKQQASLLYSHAKRDCAKERFQGKRKIQSSDDDDMDSVSNVGTSTRAHNPRNLMPWQPENKVLPQNIRKSVLSREDHKRYVSIIRNQLQPTPKYRFEQNKNEIRAMDKLLEDERKLYADLVMKKTRILKKLCTANAECQRIFKNFEFAKIGLYIGQKIFDKIIVNDIPWKKDVAFAEGAALPLNFKIVNVFTSGFPIPVTIPDIRNKFTIPGAGTIQVANVINAKFEQKVPIDKDLKVYKYALANNVPFIMDAGTLRHFLCSTWSQRPQNYACRISIIRKVYEGSMRNLVFILPPVLASRIHQTTILNALVKWSLKCTLLYYDNNKKGETISKKKRKQNIPTDSLLEDLGLGQLETKDNSKKRYAVISFDDSQKDIDSGQKNQVVIRTGLHGVEKATSRSISMTARAEFLPEVAAEKLTIEEHIWNIATGVLKGSDEHLNFRIRPQTGKEAHVVQYDRRISDFSRLDTEIRNILSVRIQRFCGFLNELARLSVGEYLAIPDLDKEIMRIFEERKSVNQDTESDEDNRSSILEKNNSEEVYDFDYFERIVHGKTIAPVNGIGEYWNGIDPHFPLQWHIVQSQIPGALYYQK